MPGDVDKLLARLKAKDEEVGEAKAAYERLTEERARLIVTAVEAGASRGMAARAIGKSVTRVQQILDRARA